VIIAALFITVKIRKMWHIYTKEYYSLIIKNKVLSLAIVWMELKDTMLSPPIITYSYLYVGTKKWTS
jgi:hypothetical protein